MTIFLYLTLLFGSVHGGQKCKDYIFDYKCVNEVISFQYHCDSCKGLELKTLDRTVFVQGESGKVSLSQDTLKGFLEIGFLFGEKKIVVDSLKIPVTADPHLDGRITEHILFKTKTNYTIFDEQGVCVKNGRGTKIETSDLPKGVYYLSFLNNTKKFIVK